MKLYVTNIPLDTPLPLPFKHTANIYDLLESYRRARHNGINVMLDRYARNGIDHCKRAIRKARVVTSITGATVDEVLAAYKAQYGALAHVAFLRDKIVRPYLCGLAPYDVLLSCAVTHACTGVCYTPALSVMVAMGDSSGMRDGFFTKSTWRPVALHEAMSTLERYYWEVSAGGILQYIAEFMPVACSMGVHDIVRPLCLSNVGYGYKIRIFKEPAVLDYCGDIRSILYFKAAKELCRALRAAGYKRSWVTEAMEVGVAPFTMPSRVQLNIQMGHPIGYTLRVHRVPSEVTHITNLMRYNGGKVGGNRMQMLVACLKNIDALLYQYKQRGHRSKEIRGASGPFVDESLIFTNESLIAVFLGTDADTKASQLIARLS